MSFILAAIGGLALGLVGIYVMEWIVVERWHARVVREHLANGAIRVRDSKGRPIPRPSPMLYRKRSK